MKPSDATRGRWLVVGGSGLLGYALCRDLESRGADVVATVNEHPIGLPRVREVPWALTCSGSPRELISNHKPDVVLYAAGLTNVDQCEANSSLADFLHAEVPAAMASASEQAGAAFVYISTDHLWDGTHPMVEEDEPLQPLNAYARSKGKGEMAVRSASSSSLILRTNFFGMGRPWRQSLSDWILQGLRSGKRVNAFSDSYFTPIAIPLLCGTIVDMVDHGFCGTYHACGAERLSKYQFALDLADWCGVIGADIRASSLAEAGLLAPRPADMSLGTAKISKALGRPMPDVWQSFAAVFGARGSMAKQMTA